MGPLPCSYLNGRTLHFQLRQDIGTTTPASSVGELLTLNSASGNNVLMDYFSAGTPKAYVGLAGAAGNVIVGSAANDFMLRAQSQKVMFSTNSGVSAAMTLDTSGNIGIGKTPGANAQLDVAKSIVSGLNNLGTIMPPATSVTFDASLGNTQKITLGESLATSNLNLINATAGQEIDFIICENGTGGWTFGWPSNVQSPPAINTTQNACTYHATVFDGTNAVPLNRDSSGNLIIGATATGITANGTNQSITIAPNGTGKVNVSTKLGSYNGDSTVSNGVASEVATSDLTAQSGSIASTNLYTPVADGMFRVSYYLETTMVGTAGTVTISITWTDDAKAETFTSNLLSLTALGALTGANQATFWAKTTAAIAYSTSVSGAAGSPRYAVHVKVERM